MNNKCPETFFAVKTSYENARIVIFGSPFDSTTSFRPGARFASRVMRGESFGLETYSPYQDLDVIDAKIFDDGDIELPFGDTESAISMIEDEAARILSAHKLPFMIGGEHLVSLGAIRAAWKKYPELTLIHFDAHTDLREEYLGVRLSHASVIRRAWDFLGDGRIWQFGVRSGDRDEFLWANIHTHLTKFDFSGLESALSKIGRAPVYFTIDLDVLDPSVFPGTGTPEAGGVSFGGLMDAAMKVVSMTNVIACDIVELAPQLDASGASTAVALKLMREMLLALEKPFLRPEII